MPDATEMKAQQMGDRARAAAAALAGLDAAARTRGLEAAADALAADRARVLDANARDLSAAEAAGRPAAFLDRLRLDEARFDALVDGVRGVAGQPDPLGERIEAWTAPSGVEIEQVRTPLGVIAVIFESRPNVVADAAALAVRSGNAALLRGGSDSLHSALTICDALRRGLAEAGLPEDAVQHPPDADRAYVGAFLSGLDGAIDVLVPRGGRDLVARVQAEARVAVLGHLDGICHIYVDASADAQTAAGIVLNSKMRRTGVCNAAECLLVDASALDRLWPPIAEALSAAGCELRADPAARALFPDARAATEEDWGVEFLDAVMAVKAVDGLDGALDHIARHGSGHTDAIIAEDADRIARFLDAVDSAVVIANASTGFSDGGEFGFGAEIGIATSRLHARGPVGARQLTSFKYRVTGTGQIRG